MTSADWDILIKAGAAVMTSVVIPWAILAYQKRTGVQVTDQQRAAVQAALTTAAGIIRTQIDQGVLHVQDVHPANDAVLLEAKAAIARVPESAAAQGMTAAAAAEIIVGRVDTSAKPPVIVIPPGNVVPLVHA